MELTYYPNIFDQPSIELAKEIILTPEVGLSTEERWNKETDWLRSFLNNLPDGLVLDYGCGIGRLSSVLSNPVIGVDMSFTMRQQAEIYVNRADFSAVNPVFLNILINGGLRVNSAICVWVLQHIPNIVPVIEQLHKIIVSSGILLVVNMTQRAIPANNADGALGWVDDKININDLLSEYFCIKHKIKMPADLCLDGAYLTIWENK